MAVRFEQAKKTGAMEKDRPAAILTATAIPCKKKTEWTWAKCRTGWQKMAERERSSKESHRKVNAGKVCVVAVGCNRVASRDWESKLAI